MALQKRHPGHSNGKNATRADGEGQATMTDSDDRVQQQGDSALPFDRIEGAPGGSATGTTRTLGIALLLFVAALLLYLFTLAPGPLSGDAGEFQTATRVWGLSHPTGYPLYMLLLKLWGLLPIGTIAYRANLLSAVLAAGAVGFSYLFLRMVTQQTMGAILGALVLAASPLFWSQALIADKYALNAFLVMAVLTVAVYWAQKPGWRRLCLLALIYGLSLTHHRTMVLFAPGLLGYLPWVDRSAGKSLQLWKSRRNWLAMLCLVLPLTLYAYLPLTRAFGQPLSTWWPSTLGDWLAYLTARGHLGEAQAVVAPFTERLSFYGQMLVDQFTIPGLILSLVGWLWLIRRRRPLAFLLLVSFGLQAFSSMAYYLDPRNQAFFLPSFMVIALTIGVGTGTLLRWLGRRLPVSPGARIALILLAGLALCVLPAYLLLHTYPEMYQRTHHDQAMDVWRQDLQHGEQARRLAEDGLSSIASNGIILGDWEQITPLRYFQLIEGLQPDAELIYPIERVSEIEASDRPLYLARTYPGLADRWHPTASGPLIALQPEPMYDLPPGMTPLGIQLGEAFDLAGFAHGETVYRPAEVVPLTLYWRAIQAPAHDYSVSLRLFGEDGQEVYKVDSQHPVLGTYPTSLWSTGEVVADYYEIPLAPDLPPGRYRWGVVLYRVLPEGGWENLKVSGTDSEMATGGVLDVQD